MPTFSRRVFILGFAAASASASGGARAGSPSPEDRLRGASERLQAVEAREGGRLGVAVLNASGGAPLLRRAGERFPMCSTFKALAAAAVLKRVDEGKERLDRRIAYGPRRSSTMRR